MDLREGKDGCVGGLQRPCSAGSVNCGPLKDPSQDNSSNWSVPSNIFLVSTIMPLVSDHIDESNPLQNELYNI